MRIVFMGTPDFAVPTLDALVAAGHDVVAAYAQPPRPAHRGKQLTPSPVQTRAEQLGIAVRTPVSLKGAAAQADFAALASDIAVVAAYGLILPQAVLDAPRLGCLNVHGSLLPRWRGAAPVQRAILAGDAETGVTIMQMDAGLDTGAMRHGVATPVLDKTAGELTDEIANIGANAMVAVLADLDAYPPVAQPEDGATYAAKIAKAEAALDFAAPAADLVRAVQAYNPFPGAWFTHDGERIRVHAAVAEEVSQQCHPRAGGDPVQPSAKTRSSDPDARLRGNDKVNHLCEPGTIIDGALGIATGKGIFRPTSIQRAGRPRMPTGDFLRGYPLPAGTRIAGTQSG